MIDDTAEPETPDLAPAGPPTDPAASAPDETPARVPLRRRRLWWLAIGTVVAVIAGGAAWVVSHPRAAPASNPYHLPTIPTGRPAPSFSLPRLGGGPPVALTGSTPVPHVINFFASWCPNCAGELSTFAAEANATRGKVAFVGIDTNDPDRGAAESMISRAGVRYAVGVDASARIATAYLVVGLPTTVFIDRSGQVIGEAFGAQTAKTLRAWVVRLESLKGS
jgi:cytochrome c biogenesis protein CcmG, thiol:disulfide interchange protein DsbE